jgi:hypothetical protein
MAMKTWKVPPALHDQYRGCGNTIATFTLRFEGERKFLDQPIALDYYDNIEMSPDAGEIVGYTREGHARVRVNLSCCEICLG